MIKLKKIQLLFLGIIILITCLIVFINLRRPVVRTNDWVAVVTTSNEKNETIPVYKMRGFPDRLLVELPKHLRGRYHWFGIEQDRVSVLSGVGKFPYRHYNHDKAFGILIDKANYVKIEDDWTIRKTDEMVEFSNADFSIVVKRK